LYVRQPEPRGLGDAIARAEGFTGGRPFAVLLGDDITLDPPCTKILREAHDRLGTSVIALQRVPAERVSRYGMVVGREIEPGVVKVDDVVEKPAGDAVVSDLVTIGRYILTPSVFACIKDAPPGHGGEIQLSDALRSLARKEDVYGMIYDGTRYDIGDKVEWLRATLHLAARREDLRTALEPMLRETLDLISRMPR
jgi:UTP--glucose-1-phosphate uridylyltransferase